MAKSTNGYFEHVQNKCMDGIESLIAEINNVSLKVVKGKVMNQKELKKALVKSESEVWKEVHVAPSSNNFKIRYATMVTSYVFANIGKFAKAYFDAVVEKDEIKKVPVNSVVEDILKYLYELCDSAIGSFDWRFYDIIYMFAVMDTVGQPYIEDKPYRLEKIHETFDKLNRRLSDGSDKEDSMFGDLLRLTYIFSTKAPSVKKAKFFVEGYEFDQKATTYRMIEKLGKVILKTCSVYSVSPMCDLFMMSGPSITSKYRAASTNKELRAGSIALSYMKFITNGTPVGDLCFWLK